VSKSILSSFTVKTLLFSLVLVAGTALRLGAQNDGKSPAGGAWSVYSNEDRMTAAHHVTFELVGSSDQRAPRGPDARGPYDDNGPTQRGPNDNGPAQSGPNDNGPGPRGPYDNGPGGPRGPSRGQHYRPDYNPGPPRVEIYCENGNYKGSNFFPGERIAPPNRPGFWGQPQMEVLVRVNDSHGNHGWNWTPDSLSMDKNTARELIGAQLFRVEYLGARGPVIAEFSPAGLELGRIAKACGLKPKKP